MAVLIFFILVVAYVLLMYTINRLSCFEKEQEKKQEEEWYTYNKMLEQQELVKKQASKKTYELLNREQGGSVQEIADVWEVTCIQSRAFLHRFYVAGLLECKKINNKIVYRFVKQNIDEDRMTSLIFDNFEN